MRTGATAISKMSRYLFRRRELPILGTSGWILALFVAFGAVSFVSCTWLVTEESTNRSAEVDGSAQHQLSIRESGSTTLRNLGLLVAGAIAIALAVWRSIAADRQSIATMRQSETASGDLWNTRFEKGVEMLASEHQAVRLGGVYALWHLFTDSSRPNRIQLTETLCAFVRQPPGEPTPSLGLREDVQTVMSVFKLSDKEDETSVMELSRQIIKLFERGVGLHEQTEIPLKVYDEQDPEIEYPLNFRSAHLNGARIYNNNFAFSSLRDASLRGATIWASDLSGAILRGADLSSPYVVEGHKQPRIMCQYNEGTLDVTMVIGSRLHEANMIGAQLVGAWLRDSDLSGALLWNADLSSSTIVQTNFSNAILTGANLSGAHLERANFSGANFRGANISGTDFSGLGAPTIGLTQFQLNEAVADPDNPPKLDGVQDSATGAPLAWHGRDIQDRGPRMSTP